MDRDFVFFAEQYGIEARNKFENMCYDLFQSEFPDDDVHKVEVKQGDGGIDVLIDHENGEYTIIQCKFVLNIGDSQKNNIRQSYKRALETSEDKITKWILCVPVTFDFDLQNWWRGWKTLQKENFKKKNNRTIKIKLYDKEKLITLMKKYNIYDDYFQTIRIDKSFLDNLIHMDETKLLHDRLLPLISSISNNDMTRNQQDILDSISDLYDLEGHRFLKNSSLFSDLQYLSNIVSFGSVNGIVRNIKVKKEIEELRYKIVKEFKALFHN